MGDGGGVNLYTLDFALNTPLTNIPPSLEQIIEIDPMSSINPPPPAFELEIVSGGVYLTRTEEYIFFHVSC